VQPLARIAGCHMRLWYGPIEGLDFELGVSYELRVREYQVPNPPADASSIRWQLLEVAERHQRS